MSVWKPESVKNEPVTQVVQWQVYEIEFEAGDTSRHIVGFVPSLREGRVSSPIIEFDKETKIATTRSGRKYELCVGSGMSSDGTYVFDTWKHINKVKKETVVTKEYE